MSILFSSLPIIRFNSESNCSSKKHDISRKIHKKIKKLSIRSAENSSWWNVKELCIDVVFFTLIRLLNRFITKKFLFNIKCCISSYWWGWIIPENHAEKYNEWIFRRGANFSRFFFHENFVNKIALDLLIKWTSHVFTKEKWRKVGSPRQYWFLTLRNMISWYFSSLWIIWDAAFYLMSKRFW